MFFSVLFSSFWPKRTFRSFLKNGKECKERKELNVFCKERKRTQRTKHSLQRTEKNARMFRSFAKERENVPFFFHNIYRYIQIYIQIYIQTYICKCISKKEWKVLLHSFFCKICNVCMTYETKKNVPFDNKKRKRTQRLECSFIKNRKELKDRNILL